MSAFSRLESHLRTHGADHQTVLTRPRSLLDRLLRRPERVIGPLVEVNPAASRDTLAAFERRHDVKLPDDVVASYLHMNGTEEYTNWDACWMRFHPIEEWKSYREEFPEDPNAAEEPFASAFVFADHGISAWFFAIDLHPQRLGRVYSLTSSPYVTAPSFSAFVEEVLSGGDRLFGDLAARH